MLRAFLTPRALFYLAYAAILTAVLVYVRFPVEKFKNYCEKHIEYLIPGSVCTIDQIVFRFPLLVRFENIKISKMGVGKSKMGAGKSSELVVNRLEVSPVFKELWKTFNLEGELFSGVFSTQLHHNKKAKSFQFDNIDIKNIDAALVAKSIGDLNRNVTGTIDFSGDYQAKISQPFVGTGQATVQIISGSMDLLQPVLSLSTINFEQIVVDTTYDNSTISFGEGEIRGKELNGDFSGELQVASPLLNSTILFSGHLDPLDSFFKTHPLERKAVQQLLDHYKAKVLPFNVGGSLNRPTFRFST